MDDIKVCEWCQESYSKPRDVSPRQWESRRFCCPEHFYRWKAENQRGKPSGKAGWRKPEELKSYAYIPCRICGEPTRYHGTIESSLYGKVHCGSEYCKQKSREITNERIRQAHLEDYASGKRKPAGGWANVDTISLEERMLEPWAKTNSFRGPSTYRFNAGLPGKSYLLDYARPDAKLNLEIDGKSHNNRSERDSDRDRLMKENGWTTIRIPANLIRDGLSEVEKYLTEWNSGFPLKEIEIETKPCKFCSEPIERPEQISDIKWSRINFCPDKNCRHQWHSQILTGRPSPKKGVKSDKPSQANFIPCRICGEPTKIQGTPAHPRWGRKACDKPECQAKSKEITRQNQSKALKGNQKLKDSTVEAWVRRKRLDDDSQPPS